MDTILLYFGGGLQALPTGNREMPITGTHETHFIVRKRCSKINYNTGTVFDMCFKENYEKFDGALSMVERVDIV